MKTNQQAGTNNTSQQQFEADQNVRSYDVRREEQGGEIPPI